MKMRRSGYATLVALALAAITLGCPAKRPSAKYEFTPPPTEWTPMRSEQGTMVFKRKDPPMGIMVNSECDRYQNVPLTPLSRSLFIGFTDRKEISRGPATVDGHEAVEVTMDCKLEDAAVRIKAYTFKAEGCIYDIAYFAQPDDFETGLGHFNEFVKTFHVGERRKD